MELLPDPVHDRVVREVRPPPHKPITRERLFIGNSNVPDWERLRDHLQIEGRVSKEHVLLITQQTADIFRSEPNMLEISDPVIIVGDIHGQYYDFWRVLEISGSPEFNQYLFLGDYVDRGDECLEKYDLEVYDRIMECFDCLPVACLLNGRYLAVHGGISPELEDFDSLKRLDRIREPPIRGLYTDLLWADPWDHAEGIQEKNYIDNSARGWSYYYGAIAAKQFLRNNRLVSIIRAHEAQIDGYKLHHWSNSSKFPVVITIFSAPNYCDLYGNKGAVAKFDNNQLSIQQYNSVEHPYLLPNFANVFTWSIPFVSEKILEVLKYFIEPKADEKAEAEKMKEEGSVLSNFHQMEHRTEVLGKMIELFKAKTLEAVQQVELNGIVPGDRIPITAIHSARQKKGASRFADFKMSDAQNESMPTQPSTPGSSIFN